MKFCIVVGTRPQIIKSQPIINELISQKKDFTIVHTGQHYDYEMSRTFFQELKIGKPDYNLGINSGSDSNQLARIIMKLEIILLKIKPDVVIVPGDTRSALGGALSANRLGLKLAHVEAGARSNDFELEEEINRRLIDNCSNFLFTPTLSCAKNLKKEGVLGSVFNVGDTMYDVFLNYQKILKLKQFSKEDFILMTIHRKENILNITKMKKIIDIANFISKHGYKVVFPIHPHTKKQIKTFGISTGNIQMTEPVNYSKMLILLSKTKLLLTDSGGLQKEAYWSNTPCFTFRKSTEWIETLIEKNNFLIPEIFNNTKNKAIQILESQNSRKKPLKNYFGNGKASKKIISILLN